LHVRLQDLVVYCNATLSQYQGDSQVQYNLQVFQATDANPQVTDNAINCCLRCAFTKNCNIWVCPSGLALHASVQPRSGALSSSVPQARVTLC
jgi:lipopolysaccharide biosynthesis regulator YciM